MEIKGECLQQQYKNIFTFPSFRKRQVLSMRTDNVDNDCPGADVLSEDLWPMLAGLLNCDAMLQ